MFKAIKEFFTGKKVDVAAAPVAPYKVETPVVKRATSPAVEAKKATAPQTKKPAAKKPAAKKPAAKKPTPTP